MLAACLAVTRPALAEIISLKAQLKGSSEVPANDSKGTGTVTATYDTATKKLAWKGDYSGLSGAATMAHFHGPADPSKNPAVILPITPSTSPFEGSATLTDAQAAELMAGQWYVNVHTAAHPGGEIRGQVVKGM
ncbi:MAG: CHRD domain-containing protein [Rhodoplanes sp.]